MSKRHGRRAEGGSEMFGGENWGIRVKGENFADRVIWGDGEIS